MFVLFTKNNAISVSLLKEMLGVKKWAVSCLKGNVSNDFSEEKKNKNKNEKETVVLTIFFNTFCASFQHTLWISSVDWKWNGHCWKLSWQTVLILHVFVLIFTQMVKCNWNTMQYVLNFSKLEGLITKIDKI